MAYGKNETIYNAVSRLFRVSSSLAPGFGGGGGSMKFIIPSGPASLPAVLNPPTVGSRSSLQARPKLGNLSLLQGLKCERRKVSSNKLFVGPTFRRLLSATMMQRGPKLNSFVCSWSQRRPRPPSDKAIEAAAAASGRRLSNSSTARAAASSASPSTRTTLR